MKYIILGHQNPDVDSVLSGVLLERILNRNTKSKNFKYIIPDDEVDDITKKVAKDLGINVDDYKEKNIDPEDKLILVDHYEETRYNNPITAIFDHHPPTSDYKPTLTHAYYNLRSCSTTTVLLRLLEDYIIEEDFLPILVAAIVDTVSFKSTKTNQDEVKLLKEKCEKYHVNLDDYLDIGLCLNDLDDLNSVYLYGLKKYTLQGKKVESSYIQIKDVDGNKDKIEAIFNLLKNYIAENNIDVFMFIVHDMDKFKSTAYEISKDGIEKTEYDKYTSRGNVIIPDLDKKLAEQKTTRI